MKLIDLIKEEDRNRKHEYACAMLYFAFPEMGRIHKMINLDDLYTEEEDDSFGLEDEPHVTLLYGLHSNVSTDDIVNVLEKFTFEDCIIHNPSLFKNEKYDVLKFDARGDNLNEVNKELVQFPHTSDFPDYHPHMTIAYLKPGKGKKYVDSFKKFKEFEITPRYGIYSKTNGDKERIQLKLD